MQSSHLPNFERKTYFHGIHLSLNQTSKVSALSTKRTSEDRIAAKQEYSRKRLVSGVAIISRFSLVSASDRLWKARVRKTEEPLTKGKNYKNERSEVSPKVLSSFTKKKYATCGVLRCEDSFFSTISRFSTVVQPLFVRSYLLDLAILVTCSFLAIDHLSATLELFRLELTKRGYFRNKSALSDLIILFLDVCEFSMPVNVVRLESSRSIESHFSISSVFSCIFLSP